MNEDVGKDPISPELVAIVTLLRSAFPDGVKQLDYAPLVFFLHQELEMSMRQTARALGFFFQRPYVDFFPEIDLTYKSGVIGPQYTHRIRSLLERHGLSEWLAEND